MENRDTKITPIPGHPGPAKTYNLEDYVARVLATENTTLYNMGKKSGFFVIIIGKTCYQVKFGDNMLAFYDTEKPGPYDKAFMMYGAESITSAHRSQLESAHISKLKNYKQFLGANREAQDLVTGAIGSHLIASLLNISLVMNNILPSRSSRSSDIARASSSTTAINWNSDPSSEHHRTWTRTASHICCSSKIINRKYSNGWCHVPTQPWSSNIFIKWRSATTSTHMI